MERLISADDHIDLGYLPRDLWTARMPKALVERGPQVIDRGDGDDYWFCDGQPWGDWRGGAWFERKNRPLTALDRGGVAKPHTLRPTTPDLRLADMDRENVEASVMFPPIFGMRVADKELAKSVIRVYNDWAADFGKAAPNRFIPVAQLFPDDAEASRDELLRIARLGLKQVNFLVGTVSPQMYMKSWDPFWDAAEETSIVVSYHVGGSGGWGVVPRPPAPDGDRKPEYDMGLSNGATMFYGPFVALFTYGTLERHPNLRFVLAESGTGWIPFVVQEMDYRFKRFSEERTTPGGFTLKTLPSEIFRRQVWATYQQDFVGLHLVDFFGDGHMMWASDYPHPDSTFPDSQDVIARETAHLTPEAKHKIIHENARIFYGL